MVEAVELEAAPHNHPAAKLSHSGVAYTRADIYESSQSEAIPSFTSEVSTEAAGYQVCPQACSGRSEFLLLPADPDLRTQSKGFDYIAHE